MSNIAPDEAKANRVVLGKHIPEPANPQEWLKIGKALESEVRRRYGIPDSAQTLAVGWTSIAGLASRRFVGASKAVRASADLPAPIAHINSPRINGQFVDHAEQDVANAFIDALSESSLSEYALTGEWLRIFVSHAKGPCTACIQGLNERQVEPGILAQLSRRYPGLTVTLAWEKKNGNLGFVYMQNGARLDRE